MIVDMTPDRVELAQLVRRFLRERTPLSETHGVRDSAREAAVWLQMGRELGLQGLAMPEAHGGADCGVVELGVVMEELGAQLYSGPYFSSVCLSAPILLRTASSTLQKEIIPPLAAGEATVALAFAEPDKPWDGANSSTTWRSEGSEWVLSGTKANVIDGAGADHLIITAAAADGDPTEISFFLVAGDAAGLTRDGLPTLDQTRSLCRVELENVRAVLLGEVGSAAPVLEEILQVAAVLLAAEQLGGAQHCLDESVDYAKTREQFGRAIGSFQSIKHACADTLLDVETARSAVLYALAALESGIDARQAASLARAHCSEVFQKAASTYVHVLGGIGFTWEHEAHLYLKRALGSRAILGSPSEHREIVAQEIGL